jgi:hypothetical protein
VSVVEDVFHHLLLDHRIGVAAGPRIREKLPYILEPARGLVDEILADTRPVDLAGYRDLGIVDGEIALLVAHGHVHHGETCRLVHLGPVEDDVLHLRAPKLPGALFSQHPPHGIHDIGLPASVRSKDTGDAGPQVQRCGIHE